MTLPLELGGIHDPMVRRAFEVLSQQFPIVVPAGGGGGAETDPVASPALATHAALTTGAHGGIVASTDPRLTDARAPTAHKTTHEPGGTDAMAVDASAATGSLRTLGTGAAQALPGNHASTTNARTPTAHATTHQPGGTDAMAVDAAAATGSLRTLGTTATSAAAGNDARLSDARTPTAHTHPAADVVSGVLATARLGSGTPAAGTYVDGGTGAWTTLPAGAAGDAMTLDSWHNVGAAGEPAFAAGVSNAGGADPVLAFRKDPTGKVLVRGSVVVPAASASPLFTLPAGYRPPGTQRFACVDYSTGAMVDVYVTGSTGVVSKFGTSTTVDTGGVEFDTDTVTTLFGWTAIPRQAADLTNATITLANTDLVFTFAANSTYLVDLYLLATSAATTTGYALAFDVSAAVTAVGLTFEHQLAAAGTLTGGDSIADAVARSLSSGVPTAAALVPILGKGIVVSGASTGTCRLQFAPEVAASATFKAGSTMRVMKAA